MEGPLRDVLPRDTQDGASAKKEAGLLLHHPFPKVMVCFPCVEGFMLEASKQPYAVDTIIIFILMFLVYN